MNKDKIIIVCDGKERVGMSVMGMRIAENLMKYEQMKQRKLNIIEIGSFVFGLIQLFISWIVIAILGTISLYYYTIQTTILVLILGEITFIGGVILIIPFINYIRINYEQMKHQSTHKTKSNNRKL